MKEREEERKGQTYWIGKGRENILEIHEDSGVNKHLENRFLLVHFFMGESLIIFQKVFTSGSSQKNYKSKVLFLN